MRLVFVIIFLFSIGYQSHAKSISKDSSITILMEKVELALQGEHYDKALIPLNKLIALDTTLPDEFSFYMGYTLYQYQKYSKSRESFLKYIEVSGESGEFYGPSLFYISKVNISLGDVDSSRCNICRSLGPLNETIQCKVCNGSGDEKFDCRNCNGSGKTICHVCGGVGVQKIPGTLGDVYETCYLCTGAGTISCFVCKGTTFESLTCKKCLGEGEHLKDRKCVHPYTENGLIRKGYPLFLKNE